MMYGKEQSLVSRTEATGLAEQENMARLELIYEVSKKVGSEPHMAQLLEKIIQMTQKTLNAMAASILLFGDNEHELFFEVASGPVGKVLKHVKVDIQQSIAGHVASTGEPLIVNDVARNPIFHRNIDQITGFSTRSVICAPLIVHQKIMGVLEVINKSDGSDFNERDLLTVVSVAATSAMAIENTRLNRSMLDVYRSIISKLAATIDAKDPYSCGHSQRVMEHTLLGCEFLALSSEEMEILEYASILHDIGKMAIDTRILNKPDVLTTSEWCIMHEHSAIGAHMLKEIPFLEKAGELVLYHHERYDGTGYPEGLKGQEIPIGARLIAVADAFDTMTTNRSYRPALTRDDSIRELCACSGTQFCPAAVEAFIASHRTYGPKTQIN